MVIKSKVFGTLNLLSPDEMKRFEEYLSSPFLNKNIRIIRLFNLIKKFHPDFDNPSFSKENLKKKLFGSKKSKDAYLRNLFSDLNEKAEEFLSYINYRNDRNYYTHLIKELYNRDNMKSFEEKLRMFEMQIEKEKFTSPGYYQDKAFVIEMKTNSKVNRKLIENLRKEDIENKFHFFLISIMESHCQTFIEQQRTNIIHDFSLLSYLLAYIQKDIAKFKKAPLLQIYYYACLCFLNKYNEQFFDLFLSAYNSNKKYISAIDKRNISSLIVTYYGEKNQTESGRYYREALNIYNEMMTGNYLSHTKTGYIDLLAVRNIIFLCMNLKDKKSFVSFINRIDKIVRQDQRKEILLYANSLYHVMLNDFEKALSFLVKIDINSFLESLDDNLYFKIDIKSYTVTCFIELGYHENALAQIDSYKHFLNYSKMLPENLKLRKITYLNFLKELIYLQMEFDEYRLFQFEKKVMQEGDLNVNSKEWFLKKCEEIKKSASG